MSHCGYWKWEKNIPNTSRKGLVFKLHAYSPFCFQSQMSLRTLVSSALGSPSERSKFSMSWKHFWNSGSVQWSKLQCPHSFLTSERTSLAWGRIPCAKKIDALSRIPNTPDRSHVLSNPAHKRYQADELIKHLNIFNCLIISINKTDES